jgi:ankyrin repeat protein
MMNYLVLIVKLKESNASSHLTTAIRCFLVIVPMKACHCLLDACKDGDFEKTKRVLENDAHVNARDEDGCTPLHFASENGYDAIVSLLLQNNADFNVYNGDGLTPLHLACKNEEEAVVSLLLKNRPDVNVKDKEGFTPLHWAAHSNASGRRKTLACQNNNAWSLCNPSCGYFINL